MLERLLPLCGRDLQRIGLSATVGNPHVIGQWLQGSSERPFRLVDPPREPVERRLRLDLCADVDEAARGIAGVARGKKSLVFVESRAKAERVAHAMAGSGVEVFIHHSSVSRADRVLAEAEFARGHNTAIVCTSTMELGIDVGDLDQVIQVDAPGSVASFLQRIGRTGRRAGMAQRCTFFCLSPESLLQALAVVRLAERGFVEEVRPAAHAMHVLAHQVMALALQEGGISRHRLLPHVQAAYPFSSVREERLHELVDTMLAREILYEADGLLSLGQRGERLYGRKNFFELYAVFTAPPLLRVQHGKDEVGYIQALFVWMHDGQKGPLCFRLAGRAWEVVGGGIDWSKGVLQVRPAERGRVPSWVGIPGFLSTVLCQEMMAVLLAETAQEAGWLTPGAARELKDLRDGYEGVLELGTAPLEEQDEGVQWHTFAGGAVNRLLAAGLEKQTGLRWVAGNLSLRCKEIGLAAAREAVAGLLALDWERVAAEAARGMTRGMVSKFQPCLPEDAEDRLLAERLLDLPGALRFLGSVGVRARGLQAVGTGMRVTEGAAQGELRLTLTLPMVQANATRDGGAASGAVQTEREIEWIDTPGALRALREVLRAEAVVGLDVETTLDFKTLCLMQIATPTRTYLVDPLAVGDLRSLAEVFEAERPTKVIHNARFERGVLAAIGIGLAGVYDTLEVSRRVRGREMAGGHRLAVVCQRELGVEMDKSAQTSNWGRRPLDAEQIRYAALDAEVLLRLYECFSMVKPRQVGLF